MVGLHGIFCVIKSKDREISFTPANVIDAEHIFKIKRQSFCRHNKVVVDEESRSLECQDCGSNLSLFDYIKDLALNHRDAVDQLIRAREDYKKLSESLEELKRREKNAKIRVRNWERKAELTEKGLPDLSAPAGSKKNRM